MDLRFLSIRSFSELQRKDSREQRHRSFPRWCALLRHLPCLIFDEGSTREPFHRNASMHPPLDKPSCQPATEPSKSVMHLRRLPTSTPTPDPTSLVRRTQNSRRQDCVRILNFTSHQLKGLPVLNSFRPCNSLCRNIHIQSNVRRRYLDQRASFIRIVRRCDGSFKRRAQRCASTAAAPLEPTPRPRREGDKVQQHQATTPSPARQHD